MAAWHHCVGVGVCVCRTSHVFYEYLLLLLCTGIVLKQVIMGTFPCMRASLTRIINTSCTVHFFFLFQKGIESTIILFYLLQYMVEQMLTILEYRVKRIIYLRAVFLIMQLILKILQVMLHLLYKNMQKGENNWIFIANIHSGK